MFDVSLNFTQLIMRYFSHPSLPNTQVWMKHSSSRSSSSSSPSRARCSLQSSFTMAAAKAARGPLKIWVSRLIARFGSAAVILILESTEVSGESELWLWRKWTEVVVDRFQPEAVNPKHAWRFTIKSDKAINR